MHHGKFIWEGVHKTPWKLYCSKSWIEGNFLPSIQLSNFALFLCNANQKIANQTMIWFGLDELQCLDKESLSVWF